MFVLFSLDWVCPSWWRDHRDWRTGGDRETAWFHWNPAGCQSYLPHLATNFRGTWLNEYIIYGSIKYYWKNLPTKAPKNHIEISLFPLHYIYQIFDLFYMTSLYSFKWCLWSNFFFSLGDLNFVSVFVHVALLLFLLFLFFFSDLHRSQGAS